jgi:hypothetical protein
MRAFEVYLNGKKLCLAGIGDHGVLTAIVNWVASPSARADSFLDVGGLVTPTNEYMNWVIQESLRVGDQILIKTVEKNSVDKPIKKHRMDPAEQLRSQKRYVRQMAKQLGWKIQSRPKRANS